MNAIGDSYFTMKR